MNHDYDQLPPGAGDAGLVTRQRNFHFHKTRRDIAAPLFRQRKIAMLIFIGVFAGAVLTALFTPRKYQAEMKIFVNRDRADAVVTPNASTAAVPVASVSQEDLNSEVELLTSRDLLATVVEKCGLISTSNSSWASLWDKIDGQDSPQGRLAESEEALRNSLTVEPLQKTTMIRVAYSSRDPRLAAHVLQTLATLYQEKHAAVHRPTGSFDFFEQQAARYQKQLSAAEARRLAFDREQGIVAPAMAQKLALEELTKFRAEQQQYAEEAYAAAARIQELRSEERTAPKRQTTEMRQTGNAELLAQLRGTLLTLRLKHTDMLVKYAPSYPPVKDVETQISETEKAIAAAEKSPVSEVTTDRVPAQDWITTDIAKARADRAEFAAEAASARRMVRDYQALVLHLDQVNLAEENLNRAAKNAEDNYLLYLRKREEARISDALDARRIVNVSIAEAPTTPALPTEHLGWILIGGFFTAGIAGIGVAYAVDQMDSSFRTPDELNRYLELKVLAAIPQNTSIEKKLKR
jgi:uncharacterized protein involved in exopolysaccharide biosynthesis